MGNNWSIYEGMEKELQKQNSRTANGRSKSGSIVSFAPELTADEKAKQMIKRTGESRNGFYRRMAQERIWELDEAIRIHPE